MRVLKLKAFARWARKERLPDASLRSAVQEMRRDLYRPRYGAGAYRHAAGTGIAPWPA